MSIFRGAGQIILKGIRASRSALGLAENLGPLLPAPIGTIITGASLASQIAQPGKITKVLGGTVSQVGGRTVADVTVQRQSLLSRTAQTLAGAIIPPVVTSLVSRAVSGRREVASQQREQVTSRLQPSFWVPAGQENLLPDLRQLPPEAGVVTVGNGSPTGVGEILDPAFYLPGEGDLPREIQNANILARMKAAGKVVGRAVVAGTGAVGAAAETLTRWEELGLGGPFSRLGGAGVSRTALLGTAAAVGAGVVGGLALRRKIAVPAVVGGTVGSRLIAGGLGGLTPAGLIGSGLLAAGTAGAIRLFRGPSGEVIPVRVRRRAKGITATELRGARKVARLVGMYGLRPKSGRIVRRHR